MGLIPVNSLSSFNAQNPTTDTLSSKNVLIKYFFNSCIHLIFGKIIKYS
jgi:hypothetical protein